MKNDLDKKGKLMSKQMVHPDQTIALRDNLPTNSKTISGNRLLYSMEADREASERKTSNTHKEYSYVFTGMQCFKALSPCWLQVM